MPTTQTSACRTLQYVFQIDIDASTEQVWTALTEKIGLWWLGDFKILGSDSVTTLEPWPGGRLYEQNGDRGLLWYTVLSIDPGSSLSLGGYCTPAFGGPLSTLITIELAEHDGGTRLQVGDALFGHIDEQRASSLESGWQQLFDALRQYVESQGSE
ncbi:MAG: SRPBCC domain-containing protein [Acidobacteriota bacterium]